MVSRQELGISSVREIRWQTLRAAGRQEHITAPQSSWTCCKLLLIIIICLFLLISMHAQPYFSRAKSVVSPCSSVVHRMRLFSDARRSLFSVSGSVRPPGTRLRGRLPHIHSGQSFVGQLSEAMCAGWVWTIPHG